MYLQEKLLRSLKLTGMILDFIHQFDHQFLFPTPKQFQDIVCNVWEANMYELMVSTSVRWLLTGHSVNIVLEVS